MQPRGVLAAALVILGFAAAAGSVGTILTAGADIAAGTASTPGTVTIDPAFPGGPLPTIVAPEPLGSLGSISGSMPAFPGAGTGADGVFTSGTGATLAGGTYNYSSYTVDPEVAVTYTGAVVINVTGNAVIAGPVNTTGDGESITFRVGGNLTITGGDAFTTFRGISTSGAVAAVTVDVQGDVRIGNPLDGTTAAFVRAASGAVTLNGHGAAAPFVIGNGKVESDNGIVMVRGAGAVTISGPNSRVQSSVGVAVSQMRVQAFGGNLGIDGGALVRGNNFAGDVLVEASAALTVASGAEVRGSSGPSIYAAAYGGNVLVQGGTLEANFGGSLTVRASGGVTLRDDGRLASENGPLVAVAHGGDFALQPAGSTGTSNASTYNGSLLLAASADVTFGSGSNAGSAFGRTDIDAFDDVLIAGTGSIVLGSFTGDLEIAAADSITAAVDVTFPTLQARAPYLSVAAGPGGGFSNARAHGGDVGLYAGAGGAVLDDLEVAAESGDLVIAADGASSAHFSLAASASLSFETVSGGIDVSNASVTTTSLSPTPLLLWVHQQDGTLDASNAFIRTADGSGTSGPVSLLVNGAALPPVASFILPKNINAKVDGQDPSRSRLVAAGFLDTGPDEVDLSGPATVDVGDLSFEVPGFLPNRSGTKFSYRSPGLVMAISASKVGSSGAKFRLLATGAFTDAPGLEERITLRFANGTAEGFGIVDLDAGRFTLGRKRGALIEPNLALYRAKANLRGGGQDVLGMKLGLATSGITPEAAPDVTVAFGAFEQTIPGSAFVPSGDRFLFKGPAGGVTQVVLDYLKETVTVKASGVDLGAIPEGGSAVPIRVALGADARIVTVRMGRKGTAFIY